MMNTLAISSVKGTGDLLLPAQIGLMSFQITVVGETLEVDPVASRTMNVDRFCAIRLSNFNNTQIGAFL